MAFGVLPLRSIILSTAEFWSDSATSANSVASTALSMAQVGLAAVSMSSLSLTRQRNTVTGVWVFNPVLIVFQCLCLAGHRLNASAKGAVNEEVQCIVVTVYSKKAPLTIQWAGLF